MVVDVLGLGRVKLRYALWGYQFGLGLILLSIIVPIVWLKWRGWF